MRVLGKILRLICGGLFLAISWCFFGVLWCITIIGIPFGLQHFKFAKLAFCPFAARIQLLVK